MKIALADPALEEEFAVEEAWDVELVEEVDPCDTTLEAVVEVRDCEEVEVFVATGDALRYS